MRTIYKYPLPGTTYPEIEMPEGAWVLTVQVQDGKPFVWARVNTELLELPPVRRRFVLVGTGHELPDTCGRYVGTFQIEGGAYVFHLFEQDSLRKLE